MINIEIIPQREDNYSFYLETEKGEEAILIDPSDSDIIKSFLKKKKAKLKYILNTHHHYDHTDGNEILKKIFGAEIAAPLKEAEKISAVDIPLTEKQTLYLGEHAIKIIETPGHTSGHICFYIPDEKLLFCADTLFIMGCGRLFEGTHQQMFSSLQKINKLPKETKIYCAHEYSLSNCLFSLGYVQKFMKDSIEKSNLLKHMHERKIFFENCKKENKPTLPSTIQQEQKTNLFLMAKSVDDFKHVRQTKDAG